MAVVAVIVARVVPIVVVIVARVVVGGHPDDRFIEEMRRDVVERVRNQNMPESAHWWNEEVKHWTKTASNT
jgi:hypothetical protein